MMANELEKYSPSMESIYGDIERENKNHAFKVFYPHWIYVSDECRLELMGNGFKVYVGEWRCGDKGLIIEW